MSRYPLALKFECPHCQHETPSRVIASSVYWRKGHPVRVVVSDTLTLETRATFRRQRMCLSCLGTFSTLEIVVPRRAEPRRNHRPDRG